MTQKSLFWNLLLLASCVAACVSLLTTGVGLARYLPVVLAWPLALAVQLGLFGLAWLLAVRHVKLRALVIALYCMTMPFSVIFSYVMLQSEFTSVIRPQEAQRALFDDLRERSAVVAGELETSLAESEEIELRLASWLTMEQAQGWTTASCEAATHCYLSRVCDRIQGRIGAWETRMGQAYPQGPGQALIFGALETEQAAITQIGQTLSTAQAQWRTNEAVFATNLDNRERLRRFDLALAELPRRDLEAVRCDAVTLPAAPAYEQFARDDALSEETPVYAFADLAGVFSLSHTFTRGDYPTLFALFLAVFIDLFVLMVAIGAAVVEETDPGHSLSTLPAAVPQWGEALASEITRWIDGALPHVRQTAEDRRAFLGRLIDTLRFDGGNKVIFVATDAEERRFGFLMTTSRAATASPGGDGNESVTFVLEDWVYPALTRYLAIG